MNDKRCMLEARIEGMQPIAVTAHGDIIQEALKGALSKLKSHSILLLDVCKTIKRSKRGFEL